MLELTVQQRAVVRHFQSNPGSLIVEATAGSGKSSTLREAILASRDPSTLVSAFNKRIQAHMEAEFAARNLPVGRFLEIKTFHALGLKLLRQHWGSIDVDPDASDELIRRVLTGPSRWRHHAVNALRFAKDAAPRLAEEDDAQWQAQQIVLDCVNDLKVLEDPKAVAAIAQAVVTAMQAGTERRLSVDYADMIWLPVVLGVEPRSRYKRVVIDEYQDVSTAQFELLERHLAPGGGIVIVGDLSQAVYGFRSADGDAIRRKAVEHHKAVMVPLTVSFRCARKIVDVAKELVPEIEAREGAPDGVVDSIDGEELLKHVRPGDFVLSRANAPLVSLAVDVWMRKAKPVIEGGEELQRPLVQILDRLDLGSERRFIESLARWHREQCDRADALDAVRRKQSTADVGRARQSDSWTSRVDDWCAMLRAIGTRVGPSRIVTALNAIFGQRRDQGALSFSSVHKAKGLEADRVFLLRHSFHRYQARDEPPSQEELNIEYVAVTRARRHLTWIEALQRATL